MTGMILFSALIDELKSNIYNNRNTLKVILRKSPNSVYQQLNKLALFTGSRYNLTLQLHFPDSKKISDIDSYGTENIGIVVDKFRKKFPVPREDIKQKAVELIGNNIKTLDAYMYEGKEGVKILLQNGRIEILPGSIHLWCQPDESIRNYGDWLMQNVYFPQLK
jgi:hypothetical protein